MVVTKLELERHCIPRKPCRLDITLAYYTDTLHRFHDENTREEDLTHPEDIAHFKKHDQMDNEQYRQAQQDRLSIVEANIPPMFRRN